MSDEHDSWFKSAFGVDLGEAAGKLKEEASAALGQATTAVSGVVQQVEGAVEGAIGGVVSAAGGVVKKVAGAVAPSGSSSGGSAGGSSGGTGSFPLSGSVGRGGKNGAGDVRAVQTALGIAADGQCGGGTIAAIEAFQRTLGQARPDGRVDPGGGTERAMSGGGRPAAAAATPAPAAGGDDSGGIFDQLQKGASGLFDGAKDLGEQALGEGGGLLEEAKNLGGQALGGAGGLFEDAKNLGGRALKGAGGLIDGAKKLGGEALEDADGLFDGAKKFGGELLGGAQAAAEGVLGNPGALLDDSGGAGGDLDLSGNFHHELPETKFAEFPATSKVQGSLKLKSEINAQIVKGGSGGPNKLSVTTNKGLKFERQIAKQKADDFSNETLRNILKTLKIKETKETISTEFSQKKIKISVGITATIGSDTESFINGTAKAELVLISAESEKVLKDPSDFVVTGGAVEGGVKGENIIPMDSIGLEGFGLKVQVTVVISGTVAPNFKVIFKDAAEELLEKGGKEASKQLLKMSEAAAFDVVITAGLVLVAIATVAATARSLAVAGEERQLAGQVGLARNQFTTGMGLAMRGESNPGGGFVGLGFRAGDDVFQKAKELAQKKNPDAPPDEIFKLAVNACATVSKDKEIQPTIVRTIGEMFFLSWVKTHHGFFDTASEAKTACTICYARAVVSVDDPDMKPWNDAKNS